MKTESRIPADPASNAGGTPALPAEAEPGAFDVFVSGSSVGVQSTHFTLHQGCALSSAVASNRPGTATATPPARSEIASATIG